MKKQVATTWRKLGELRRGKRGNATMLTALALPALIGASGYGVDTAQWYMWKRELQHSVDQAALGGAWARSYSPSANYQTRALQEFNANQAITAQFAATPSVSLTSYSGGTNNSVLVTVTATRRLPFSGYLFNKAATISVSAQASFAPGGTYSACLVSLKETGTAFTVGGNATVIANCGLGALSCDPNAIVIDGSASVTTTSIVTCGTASVPANLQSQVTNNASGLEDVYADWEVPAPTGSTPGRSYNCVGNGNNAIASLQPGRYTGGLTASCNTTFAPGIYFFDGGTVDLTTNANVIGNNVLFVLMNNAKIKLGGQGNGSLQLSPMTQAQLETLGFDATQATRLSKMLIMQDDSTTEPVDIVMNGNASVTMSGILYLPKGNVTVNGNASSSSNLCFQISSYTLHVSGSAYLQTLCNANQTSSIGNSAATVRLVG